MNPIKENFKHFIQTVKLSPCKIPIISNYSAAPYPSDADGILKNMVNQIDSKVKWLQSVEYVLYQGEYNFMEVGPGEVRTMPLAERRRLGGTRRARPTAATPAVPVGSPLRCLTPQS